MGGLRDRFGRVKVKTLPPLKPLILLTFLYSIFLFGIVGIVYKEI